MGYLIDTNVLSEMRKGTRGNPQLIAWTTRVPQREMFLSVLVIGEVRYGIESVRRRDAIGPGIQKCNRSRLGWESVREQEDGKTGRSDLACG